MKHAIPVSSNLEKRGVPSFNCKTCGAHEDDLHVFLKCPLAEDVWCNMPISVRPLSSVSSVADLFKQGDTFLPLPPVGLTTPLWSWVVWNLWKARNKLVFENRAFTAQEVILKSIKDAKEWSNAQVENRASLAPNASSPTPHRRNICPPPTFQPGTLVCKVDASWDTISGRCGIGGIFSGVNTVVLLPTVSEAHNHVSSALMAGAIAVHRAVSLAVYSNVRYLAVLSDSSSFITLFKKGGSQSELFGIMFDIYHLIPFFDVISFNFIFRNFNVEADCVAKSALASSVMNSSRGA